MWEVLSCKFCFLYADILSVIICILIVVCMSSWNYLSDTSAPVLRRYVGHTGKSVTAFLVCHHSSDRCWDWRVALSEAGTGKDVCGVRPQVNTLAQPEAHPSVICIWVFVGRSHAGLLVLLAVVTPHLSFSSSVACLLPKWHSNPVKPQRSYLRVL